MHTQVCFVLCVCGTRLGSFGSELHRLSPLFSDTDARPHICRDSCPAWWWSLDIGVLLCFLSGFNQGRAIRFVHPNVFFIPRNPFFLLLYSAGWKINMISLVFFLFFLSPLRVLGCLSLPWLQLKEGFPAIPGSVLGCAS